jgi:GT2 family glycosyltransferase
MIPRATTSPDLDLPRLVTDAAVQRPPVRQRAQPSRLSGLIAWARSGWEISGASAPRVLARHLALVALNRTSRARAITALPKSLPVSAYGSIAKAANAQPAAGDVIVPIYNNFEGTRSLLGVLANDHTFSGKIFVIDDHSPDPRVLPMLRAYAQSDARVHVLRNSRNLGFVATCNRGLNASQSNVVILNTDIALPAGGIARLLKRLGSGDNIATVTPFSNSAYGVGFPNLVYANAQPFAVHPDIIDYCLRDMPVADIELPSGNGFCMAIARKAIDTVGTFDESFGRGYGEETDFCQRTANAGMRHVLATDVYVGHLGGQSFGDNWQDASRRGLLRVLHRHPEFVNNVRSYLAAGETRAFIFAAMVRLVQQRSGRALMRVHDGDKVLGGAQAYLRISRSGAAVTATLTFAGEAYPFHFANDALLEDCLRWAGAAVA